MSHPNLTNGASLEDCYTNFFALADLCGIKWRRLATPENYLSKTGDLLDDPVLSSYHKCLTSDLLSVWRRVISRSNDSSLTSSAPNRSGTNSDPHGSSPSSHLNYKKELWVFWYGDDLEHSKFISNELTEIELGSWENGMSYECRTLLFKAFHNRIERCLLSRGFARLGRWFVQPMELSLSYDKSSKTFTADPSTSEGINDVAPQLSFAFSFFVHGESTVCTSVDVRVLPPVYRLNRNNITVAQGSSSGLNVIISPYGLAGVVTGQTFKDGDASVQKLLTEWEKFYPLRQFNEKSGQTGKYQAAGNSAPSYSVDYDDSASKSESSLESLPSVVEVNVAGVKMKYPSSYVYIVPETRTKSSDSSKNEKKDSNSKDTHLSQSQMQTSRTSHSNNLLANLLTPPSTPPELLFKDHRPHRNRTPVLSPRQPQRPLSGYCIRSNAFQEMSISHNTSKSFENMLNESSNQSSKQHAPVSLPSLSSSNSSTVQDANVIPSQETKTMIQSSPSPSLPHQPSATSSTSSNQLMMNANEDCLKKSSNWGYCDPTAKTPCNCHRCKVKELNTSPPGLSHKNTGSNSSLSSMSSAGRKSDKFDKHHKSIAKSTNPFHKRTVVPQELEKLKPSTSNDDQNKDVTVSTSQVAPAQPKTPTYNYKSPLGIGGLPSLTSSVTTPGGTAIDSPRSIAQVASIEGPASISVIDVSLPSLSPLPSKEDVNNYSNDNPSTNGAIIPKKEETAEFGCNNSLLSNSNESKNNQSLQDQQGLANPESKVTQCQSANGIKRPLLPVETSDNDSYFFKKLLYDFSSVETIAANLEIPRPRNRRVIKGLARHDELSGPHNSLRDLGPFKSKDPYEFSDFDDEGNHFRNIQVEMNHVQNNVDQVAPGNNLNGQPTNKFPESQEIHKDSKNILPFAKEVSVMSPKIQKVFTREEDIKVREGDLNKIFESDDDDSTGFSAPHVPSLTNKPQGSTQTNPGLDDTKTNSRNNASNVFAELTRIFPTPPSLEHNATPSPCNNFNCQDMTLIDDLNGRDKLDAYPSSPLCLDNVKDWSYVYKSPVQCKFIISSKYAPLSEIPSYPQNQLSPQCKYKYKEAYSLSRPLKGQIKPTNPIMNQNQIYPDKAAFFSNQQPAISFHGPTPSHQNPINKAKQFGYFQQYNGHNSAPHVTNQHPSMLPHHTPPLPQHHSHPNHHQSNLPMNRLGLGLGPYSPSSQMHHSQNVMNPNVRMMGPNNNRGNYHQMPLVNSQNPANMYMNNQHPLTFNPGDRNHPPNSNCGSHYPPMMDSNNRPSPGVYNPFPQVSSNSPLPGHHQSPSMNSIPGMGPISYDIQHQAPLMAVRNTIAPASHPAAANLDAYAVLANLVLSDSMLNLYKDHNFESCTLCACNGNIKGSDIGIYLPNSLLPCESDEPHFKCVCGFSAVSNRHRSYFAGLFYEDEVEITGVIYDPIERLEKKSLTYQKPGLEEKIIKETMEKSHTVEDLQSDANLLNLIKSQCSSLFSSTSPLTKAAIYESLRRQRDQDEDASFLPILLNSVKVLSKKAYLFRPYALERSDGCEITYSALVAAKHVMVGEMPMIISQQTNTTERLAKKSSCLHPWSFNVGSIPSNNLDAVRFLRSLTLLLQESVGRKPQAMWEATYPVSGPLTWKQFHKLVGRGTEDQCEPQPIPSLLVGYDNDWVALSPFALKFWEKLMLEPYSVTRDVAYIVIAPEDDYLQTHVKTFFKELSTTYQMLRLGKHSPIVKIAPNGILRVSKKDAKHDPIDEWFNKIGDNDIATKIRLYAKACRYNLAPHLRNQSLDKSLFDNRPVRHELSNSSSTGLEKAMSPHLDNTNDARLSEESFESTTSSATYSNSQTDSSEQDDNPNKQPVIVVYMVEPFTFGTMSDDIYRLSCLGLMKSYLQMLDYIPEHLHNSINLQLVSLDAVLNHGRDYHNAKRLDQLKALSFSVFDQCRKVLVQQSVAKTLTGFGPAASLEVFLKSKDSSLSMNRIYTPPFILAPLKDKQTELEEMFGDRREKSQIIYCAYCLTEDQKWLVVTCSNDKGDLLESTLINVEVPKRTRRPKASVKKFGLRKVLEFVFSVMTEAVQPWRLVIGRLGRVGHGELREWSSLLTKKSLLKFSRMLKEKCRQCSIMSPYEIPCILSACLVSLEADTRLRVFTDNFTFEDRFNNSTSSCPLSTPEEASCTHILVFPTSASSSSSGDNIGISEEDLIIELDAGTDLDAEMDLINGFNWAVSPPGSPDSSRQQGLNHSDSPLRQGGFDMNMKGSMGLGGDFGDDQTNPLQQPLALGYYVSTAPTGPLPRWFWSSCPHHTDLNPVFLKSALLVHTSSVQSNDDLSSSNFHQRSSHPLDSSLTTDVLRCVLEGYNSLSWISLDPATHDRMSCLPVHIQILMQLYHTVQALV